MNYAFYDFETTGRSGTWDQIIQVGAVLVNAEFQELDRFEAKCGLRPGLVPEPGALLVNKTTPDMLRKTNLSHYGLVEQMLQTFKKWTPAKIGRASCRERVEISVVAGAVKKKEKTRSG